MDSWYQLAMTDEDDEEKVYTVVNHKGYSVNVSDERNELFNWLCHHFSPTHIASTEPEVDDDPEESEPEAPGDYMDEVL